MNASSSFGVYFYVQRHEHMPTVENGVIRHNIERLNIVRAMDISTGVFTAPKTSICHFSIVYYNNERGLHQFWCYEDMLSRQWKQNRRVKYRAQPWLEHLQLYILL